MLKILKEFPENVVAVKAIGEVTQQDYKDVLIPAVDAALKRDDKVRLFYVLDKEFSTIDMGAMWEDTKVSLEYFTHWDRVAIVTDVEWIRFTMNFFSFLFPVRVFHVAQEPEARIWIKEKNEDED